MAFSEDYSIKQKKRVEDETSSWFVGSTHSLEDLDNIKKQFLKTLVLFMGKLPQN